MSSLGDKQILEKLDRQDALKMKWSKIFVLVFGAIIIVGSSFGDIAEKYLYVYRGIVSEKLQVPPKMMHNLYIRGTNNVFPLWKWSGIDFTEVQLGDSIVKRKWESIAHYYKREENGEFLKVELSFWH